MDEELPTFRYHPDPVATGAFRKEDWPCSVCKEARGWLYSGPRYGERAPDEVCPWCIKSGRMEEETGSELNPFFGGGGKPDGAALDEVIYRTPGFSTFQEATWLLHCTDACAYLGGVDATRLVDLNPDEKEAIRRGADAYRYDDVQDLDGYIERLSHEADLCAYLFRCLECGELQSYVDRS